MNELQPHPTENEVAFVEVERTVPASPAHQPAVPQNMDLLRSRMRRHLAGRSTPEVLVVEGGHFAPVSGATPFAQDSLAAALQLAEETVRTHGRRVRVIVAILVDDLGLQCGSDGCVLHPSGKSEDLPDLLEAQLASHWMVRRQLVHVQTERNARNRGLQRLKRWLADPTVPIVQQDDLAIFRSADGQEVQIAHRSGDHWVADCPLVMGQHYADLFSHACSRFGAGRPVTIVDFSDALDRNKVCRGAQLAQQVAVATLDGTKRPGIVNVFLPTDGSRVLAVERHLHP